MLWTGVNLRFKSFQEGLTQHNYTDILSAWNFWYAFFIDTVGDSVVNSKKEKEGPLGKYFTHYMDE